MAEYYAEVVRGVQSRRITNSIFLRVAQLEAPEQNLDEVLGGASTRLMYQLSVSELTSLADRIDSNDGPLVRALAEVSQRHPARGNAPSIPVIHMQPEA